MPTVPSSESDFEAEMDLDTLQRAAEIERTPGRKSKAMAKARRRMQDLEKVTKRETGDNATMRQGFRRL